MKLLVTGAGGQLGTDLVRHAAAMGDDVVALARTDLDVTDRAEVAAAVAAHAPDAVVHAAAWTAVDACEDDPDRAHEQNAIAVRWVADACRRSHAHLVHVSTDYVFDGTKTGAYTEWDAPSPTSVYGASKLAGEVEATHQAPGSSVVRTAWVMGAHGSNMLKTVLSLRARESLAFVDDQRGCPSFTADLAVGLRQAAIERVPGTLHLTNEGAVTWYQLVRDILEMTGEDPDKVRPIATADLDPPRPAPRPANSVLDGSAWRCAGLPAMPHYRDSLRAAIEDLLSPARSQESQ